MRSTWSPAAIGLILLAATAGCTRRAPNVNPYVHGRPPEYKTPGAVPRDAAPSESGQAQSSPPEASTSSKPLSGERDEPTAPSIPPEVPRAKESASVPTLEASRPALADALARLSVRDSAEYHREAARQYMRAGVADTAMSHLDLALRRDHADADAYDLRARLWRDGGFPGYGLGDAYRAVHLAPGSASAHNTLGTLFHRLHRYPDARHEYEHALMLSPGASYVLINLCTLAADERRVADAEEACRQALAAAPGSQVTRRNLARLSGLSVIDAGGERERH